MKRSDYIGQLCMAVLPAVLMVFLGCSRNDIPNSDRETEETKTFMAKLDLTVGIAGRQDMQSRAKGQDSEPTTPGTEAESTINTLTVFVVEVDDNGNEGGMISHATFPVGPWTSGNTLEGDEVKIEVSNKGMHIYVGANLTNRQIKSFALKKNAAYTVSTGTDKYVPHNEMMAEFTGTNEKPAFTMFGQATQGTANNKLVEVTVPENPETEPVLELDVALTRMVAKALVTVSTYDNKQGGVQGVKYAKVKDDDNGKGNWIRLDDIYFRFNVANRRTFFMQKRDGTDATTIVDPNHQFEDLIELGDDGVFHFKSDDKSREFSRWIPNIWKDNKEDKSDWGMAALEYSDDKMPGISNPEKDGVYTKGLYCLENTVGQIPSSWKTELGDNKEAVTLMATTYVLIGVKMTPRYLITKLEEDPTYKDAPTTNTPQKADTETKAQELLKRVEDDPEENPDGTFYTIDREYFYTYNGMMKRIKHDETLDDDDPQKVTRESFVAYPGGWGYHFTYLDGTQTPEGEGRLKFDANKSSVLRNHYYVLHVKEFSTPPLPGDFELNTMGIEVTRYGWTEAGTGDITLKP